MRKNIFFTVMSIGVIVGSIIVTESINAKTVCTSSPDNEENKGFCMYSYPKNDNASCVDRGTGMSRCSGVATVIDHFSGVDTDIHAKP